MPETVTHDETVDVAMEAAAVRVDMPAAEVTVGLIADESVEAIADGAASVKDSAMVRDALPKLESRISDQSRRRKGENHFCKNYSRYRK